MSVIVAWAVVAYIAIACTAFGVGLAENGDEPGVCVLYAVVWPASLLVVLGLYIGRKS